MLYFRVFSAPTKKQLLERRGGGKGQKQPSTPVGLQAATSTAMPPSTLFVQSVQCEVTLARAGVISNAVLKIIAPKLPSKSALFFISCSLFLPDSTGLMTQIIRTAFETVSQGFRVYWMPKQPFLTIGALVLRKTQAVVHDDPPGQGATTGINWRNVATGSYGLPTAIHCGATCTVGSDTRISRSNEQYHAQHQGDKAYQQKHLFLHVKILAFCPRYRAVMDRGFSEAAFNSHTSETTANGGFVECGPLSRQQLLRTTRTRMLQAVAQESRQSRIALK